MAIDDDLERLERKFAIMGEAAQKELEMRTIINGGGERINN